MECSVSVLPDSLVADVKLTLMSALLSLAITEEPVMIYHKVTDVNALRAILVLIVRRRRVIAGTTPALNVPCAKTSLVSITIPVSVVQATLESIAILRLV